MVSHQGQTQIYAFTLCQWALHDKVVSTTLVRTFVFLIGEGGFHVIRQTYTLGDVVDAKTTATAICKQTIRIRDAYQQRQPQRQ